MIGDRVILTIDGRSRPGVLLAIRGDRVLVRQDECVSVCPGHWHSASDVRVTAAAWEAES